MLLEWKTGRPLTYAPFELNYGYMPQSGQYISTDTTFKGVKQFAQQAVWNLLDVHNAIIEHRIEQTHYSNKHHNVGLYRNVRIIDLNLSVGITNPRRLNLIFIYIFISKIIIQNKRRLTLSVTVKH